MARPRRRCVLFEGTCFDAAEEWLGGWVADGRAGVLEL